MCEVSREKGHILSLGWGGRSHQSKDDCRAVMPHVHRALHHLVTLTVFLLVPCPDKETLSGPVRTQKSELKPGLTGPRPAPHPVSPCLENDITEMTLCPQSLVSQTCPGSRVENLCISASVSLKCSAGFCAWKPDLS